jgi:CubicO group peptidase (beta-lactamase class C family)
MLQFEEGMKSNLFRRVLFLFAFVIAPLLISTAQYAPADVLVGLWGVEQSLGPLMRGELVIDARGTEWRARIAGYDIPVDHRGKGINFVLPGSVGEFRGHFDAGTSSIVGHWVQPANAVYSNRYASPVVLSGVSKAVWRGVVVPLDETVSFYLSIKRASDGSLTAYIRNPEFNFFRGRTFHVEMKGTDVTFSQHDDELHASYEPKEDTITAPLLDSSPPMKLTRRKNNDAIGFYPRVIAREQGYVYHPPLQENDGWPTASLADVGLREKPLSQMIERILKADLDENPLPMQSLLIARHGKLVLEEYFYGFSRERPHDTRSAGKSWATMLVGVARQHGANLGPETPVYPLFPQYKPFAHWDQRKAKLTLRDLMTMTSGLACDDSNQDSPGQEDRMQSQTEQPDWYKYTLDLPMAEEPGGDKAIYCSADINLVGGAVHQATGKWLPDIFQEDFAQPLQIHEYHLNLMPTGEAYMGGGIYMRPRDLLKLGQLYLNGGVWNGNRVIAREWIDESTHRWSQLGDILGRDHQYGYAWHIYHFTVRGNIYRMYFAGGNGGQLVMVFPELDMVANYNGGAYGEAKKFFGWQALLVPQYIIPAALPQADEKSPPSKGNTSP